MEFSGTYTPFFQYGRLWIVLEMVWKDDAVRICSLVQQFVDTVLECND